MFSGLLQPTHLILILLIALIIFGPGKIPDIGKALGEAVKSFRDNSNESEEKDKKTVYEIKDNSKE